MAVKHLICFSLAITLFATSPVQAAVLGWMFGQGRSSCDAEASIEPMPERAAADVPPPAAAPAGPAWHDDYPRAYGLAKSGRKMLLINFVPQDSRPEQQGLERAIAARPDWQQKMQRFVLCKIPANAEITVKGKPVRLLTHGAFAEMHGRPGIAVVDLANQGQSYYGHVVSAFPFMMGKYYRWHPNHLAAVLDLPPGTITQRTMIWAVRTHPERPASTSGVQDPALATAASSHSRHQATIGVQGHHNWDGRFHRLRRLLGGGLPVEVVAESWPGQTMIDSCVDCVQSWRQSSGHWSAVRSPQSRFGYDIRRGLNGVWYGTGIFLR